MMGNRSTDPYSQQLGHMEASSPGWPEFLRVFPIIDWDYELVWQFLKVFSLPYCSLYDAGYTSLGEKHNSQPNPSLRNEDGSFKPAF